ncbi:hypothetical protein [Anaerostipes sp.]|uniref:hypothetical protein n=1 Tax=Anaerostipes sp. TaxID=1872530 RepID=UPI0025C727C8|nr:hypothetical protein [Anaerostipes sp.]MBS7007569.1 hypothetical protein [Anaerostipes sp.]
MEAVITAMTAALKGFSDQGMEAVAATVPYALPFVGVSIVLGLIIGIFRKVAKK